MENILVQPDGRLLHIDFGWAFSRDPKTRSAKLKVSPEMIEAMGGVDSLYFKSFVSHFTSSWLIARDEFNSILSNFIVMKRSGITAIE